MKPVRLAGNPFGRGLEEAHEVKQVEQAVYLYPLQQSLVVLATEWTHVSTSLGKGKANKSSTVEPLNNGHVWGQPFCRYREIVLSSEVKIY